MAILIRGNVEDGRAFAAAAVASRTRPTAPTESALQPGRDMELLFGSKLGTACDPNREATTGIEPAQGLFRLLETKVSLYAEHFRGAGGGAST
jgi:hypothetical protein